MLLLFRTALQNRRHLITIVGTICAMLLLTVASQMEICSLGVMASKGPDFFELFAPIEDGKLTKGDSVTLETIEGRWHKIDVDDTGAISKQNAHRYLARHGGGTIIERVVRFLDETFGISENVLNLAFILIFVALFKACAMFLHRYCVRMVAIRVSRELRERYFDHIQTLPMSFYHKYNIGSISSRVVADAQSIADAVNSALINYLQTPLILVTTFALCLMTSWRLSLIIFCGFPLIVFPIVYLARKIKKTAKALMKNQEHFASVLIDYLNGIQTVKMFNMESFSLKKYREQNENMAALERKVARYDLASRPIIHTIAMMFLATALIYGLYVANMSVGEIFFFCGLLYLFYEPIKRFADENANIQRGVAASERMFEVMRLNPTHEDAPGAVEMDGFEQEIAFNNVSFRYGEQWVLKDLSFTVPKGKTVAIVGPTGAGKSTIVQLLPRLYEIEKGSITVDGKPIHEFTQRSLRENLTFVPQRPFLFLDTVTKNIAFGRDYSRDDVVDAAKRAHADEFIVNLPGGYDSELEEAGKNLSGGQQQRLAIARALVKKAPVLVLDEATSSLDTVSEQKIKEAIEELHGQMTQVIIAHRLSTIEDADKIIYLEDGRKIAEGTKEELLESCPQFQVMWRSRTAEKEEPALV